jgi:hypothetical protein
MLFVDICSHFIELVNNPNDKMPFNVLLMGSNAIQHWLRDMYSDLVELSDISVCSLLDQRMGTPAKTMVNHAQNRHKSRKCANY